MVYRSIACVAVAAVLNGTMADAADQTPSQNREELSAHTLATRVFNRPNGADWQSQAKMTLSLAKGLERQRSFTSYQRDTANGEEKILMRFLDPAAIRETGLLVITDSDEIRLFLPALDRVRRISSSNRGGRFVQSQLYYEDLQLTHPRDQHHQLLENGTYQGVTTHVLESTPIDPASSVYSKRVSWIHPETLVPLRVDFYKGGDSPIKRLEVLRLDEVQGYWTVTDSLMTDLNRGDSTRITVNAIRYDIGLPDSLFTTSALASPEDDPPFPQGDPIPQSATTNP